MDRIHRKIDKLGRVVLPIHYRRALGLEGEAEIVLEMNGNTITIKRYASTCRLCGSFIGVSEDFCLCSSCIDKIQGATAKRK